MPCWNLLFNAFYKHRAYLPKNNLDNEAVLKNESSCVLLVFNYRTGNQEFPVYFIVLLKV